MLGDLGLTSKGKVSKTRPKFKKRSFKRLKILKTSIKPLITKSKSIPSPKTQKTKVTRAKSNVKKQQGTSVVRVKRSNSLRSKSKAVRR